MLRAAAPTPSITAAVGLLTGLIAPAALPLATPFAAVALVGAACVARGRLGLATAGVGIGLLVGWNAHGAMTVEPGRPVVGVVERIGSWHVRDDAWVGRARLERLRQAGAIVTVDRTIAASLPVESQTAARRLRVHGYLRPGARSANFSGSRPGPWRLSTNSRRLVTVIGEPGRLTAAVDRLRSRVAHRAAQAGGEGSGAALAATLALGDRGGLSPEAIRSLRRVGLSHVVALSGLHLGILAAWCAAASRRLSLRSTLALIVVVTAAYLLLAGGRPSLVRSWAMVAAVAATGWCKRPPRPIHALLWTAAALALVSPRALFELSFQLTFTATLGIVVAHRAGRRGGSGRRRDRPVRPVLSTVAAQLATAPLALPAFHWMPGWSWLWNLALAPAVAVATPLALLWTGLAVLAPAAAQRSVGVLDLFAGALEMPARLPPALFGGAPWPGSPPVAGWLALLVVWTRRGSGWLVAGGAALVVTLSWSRAPPVSAALQAEVHFLDVGQGDATLLVDGGGAMLVDGGGWRSPGIAEAVLLPVLGELSVRSLEVVVVSHGDRDHCAGLLEIAGYLPIQQLWLAPAAAESDCGRELVALSGVEVLPLWAGREAAWREWRFLVLSPPPGDRRTGNDGSLVLAASSRGRTVLFTGDLGRVEEARLAGSWAGEALRADLLKVGHHGSRSSSSLAFLRVVRPRLAVISSGRHNPFNHPSPETLARLRQQGIRYLSTARDGRVVAVWRRGGALRVSTPGAPK